MGTEPLRPSEPDAARAGLGGSGSREPGFTRGSLAAVETLREEHRWIARMLDCLDRTLDHARRTGRLEAAIAAELLALFVHFADGLHQLREESCLFPRLLARARRVEQRVALGRLCGDHEHERQALRSLGESLLGAIYGQPGELCAFLQEAELFVALHRRHLGQEEHELLPLSDELLTEEDDAQLLAMYRSLEAGGPDRASIGRRILALCERTPGATAAQER